MGSRSTGTIVVGSLLAILFTGCSASRSEKTGQLRAEDRDSGFVLTITSPRQVWAVDEPIVVDAEFAYLGPGERKVFGPGPGSHIGFSVIELTGHRRMEAIWLLACASWTMNRAPLSTPLIKSGGWDANDPDAAFYQLFVDDPEFRLPVGRWEVAADAPFSLGPDSCGGQSVNLHASLTLIVQ